MSLDLLLKKLVKELRPYAGFYALCGGLAASLYRVTPRVTNDIDIALALKSLEQSKRAAKSVLKAIGLTPTLGWIAGTGNRIATATPMIIGRRSSSELSSTVDFLLPAFPWVKEAVRRAQFNLVDFGAVKLPVITPEDLILAKIFALNIEPSRFSDLDDLQSIFKGKLELDLAYITGELSRLKLRLPRELESVAPAALKKLRKRR